VTGTGLIHAGRSTGGSEMALMLARTLVRGKCCDPVAVDTCACQW
jgi:hypothetical protein